MRHRCPFPLWLLPLIVLAASPVGGLAQRQEPDRSLTPSAPHLSDGRNPLVSGRILGWDGTPIAGATVYAAGVAPPFSITTAATDSTGRYALNLPAGSYTLTIYASGRSTSPPERRLTVPPAAMVNFVLARLYPIRGTVRDGLGRPVGGARVSGGYQYATTGPDGHYVVECEAGERGVYAEKDGYQRAGRMVRVPPPTIVDIALLAQDGEITGKVVDVHGQAVPDAYVIIRSGGADGYEGSAFGSPDGSFKKQLGAGTYVLNAVQEGRTIEGVRTVISQSDEPLTVTLKSRQTVTVTLRMTLDPYTIEGTLFDRDGRPLKETNVSAELNGIKHTVRTDQGGQYKIFVTPGAYRVYAEALGPELGEWRSITPARCVLTPPNAVNVDLHLNPLPDGGAGLPAGAVTPAATPTPDATRGTLHTLSGYVLEATGAGIPGASVSVYGRRATDFFTTTTDRRGFYSVTLPAGEYGMSVNVQGRSSQPPRKVTLPHSGPLNFAFPPAYTIRGTVRDGQGRPLVGAQVRVGLIETVTGPDGRYALVVEDSEMGLLAFKLGYQSNSAVVLVPPPAVVNVTLPRIDTALAGTVVDASGAPVPQAVIKIEQVRGGYRQDLLLGPDAKFNHPLGASMYAVWAVREGYSFEGLAARPVPPPSQPLTITLRPNQPVTVTLRLTLNPHTLSGTVYDAGGKPVKDTWVYAEGSGPRHMVRADERGQYAMRVLPGAYRVYADWPLHSSQEQPQRARSVCITVPPDEREVDLHFCGTKTCPDDPYAQGCPRARP